MRSMILGTALVLAAAPVAAGATTYVPTDPTHFYLTNGTTPFSSVITAYFTDSFGKSTSFTDMFSFTIPDANGFGNATISTGYVSNATKLIIDSVSFFNGVTTYTYAITPTASGQTVEVSMVPIFAGLLNTLTVTGHTLKTTQAAVFSGTAVFEATVVPEPASWAMMIGGVGVLGAALRRRRSVAVSYA